MSWTPDSGLDIDETGDIQVIGGHAEFIIPVRRSDDTATAAAP